MIGESQLGRRPVAEYEEYAEIRTAWFCAHDDEEDL
jgi:hypothetical protein